jgi:hypothetical protein
MEPRRRSDGSVLFVDDVTRRRVFRGLSSRNASILMLIDAGRVALDWGSGADSRGVTVGVAAATDTERALVSLFSSDIEMTSIPVWIYLPKTSTYCSIDGCLVFQGSRVYLTWQSYASRRHVVSTCS